RRSPRLACAPRRPSWTGRASSRPRGRLARRIASSKLRPPARLARAGLLEPALEALDPATRVHQLLLAGVERVASGADLDVDLGFRRAGLEGAPAGADDVREDVLGMDLRLHLDPRYQRLFGALRCHRTRRT